jgi:hypothetical protein
MPTVTVNPRTPVRITVQDKNNIIKPYNSGYATLKTQAAISAPSSVAGLTDVNLTSVPPLDGSTLIYNSSTAQYDVDIMDIDGGQF